MNQPPIGPDPYATQPIPVTPPPGPPPRGPSQQSPAGFIPRFGNVPFYVLSRFLAFAIDGFAISFVVAAFAFNALEPGGVSVLSQRDEGAFGTIAAIALGGSFVFAFVCEGLFGTTLGKSVFALRVRRADGRHADVGRVFVRALLRPVDLFVIGPVLALVTPRHQRLGDFAGGSIVSYSRVGPLASAIAIVLLGGLVYAQIVFGGGITSALGVAAEAAAFGPDYAAKAGALVGLAIPHAPLPAAPGAAAPAPSHVPTPVPSLAPTEAPSDAASDAAPAIGPSDEPTDASTDAPTDAPTDAATDAPAEGHV